MASNLAAGPAPRAGRQEWIGLAVLALPTLLLSIDLSVLYLALLSLSADLSPSGTQMLWIMDIYGFMIAGFLVTMGTLGDRIGRRKLLMIGAAAFGMASVIAAYSSSAEMLIAARAVLGIAGATLMPSTLALISNMFRHPRQRSVGIAIWLSSFIVGQAIGPVIGGILLEAFWWGSAFLLGVPIMLLLLVAAPLLLPEFRDEGAGRIDLASVALSLAAILPIIHGIKGLANDGVEPLPIVTIAAGALVGAAFVQRQRGLAAPLVDVGLFRRRSFTAALGIMLAGSVTAGGVFLFTAQYLQLVEGLSPLRAGWWLLPPAIATITGAMLAPAARRRAGAATIMGASVAIGAAGHLVLTQVDHRSGLTMLVTGMAVVFFSGGIWGALGTDLVVGSVPPEKAGSASSLSETAYELGGALGVAVLGSIGTAVYRTQATEAVPGGVSAVDAASARDTLAGAVEVAARLPTELGAPVLQSAAAAFANGLNTVAAMSAVVSAFMAVVAVTLLREAPLGGEAAADSPGLATEGESTPTVERSPGPAYA